MDKIKKISKKIRPALKKYDVIKAGIFGSLIRGESNAKSDLDLLIEFNRRI